MCLRRSDGAKENKRIFSLEKMWLLFGLGLLIVLDLIFFFFSL